MSTGGGRSGDAGGEGVPVPDDAIDELVAAADEGVTAESLTAGRDADGYHLSVGGVESATGLDESGLRETARRHGAHVAEWHFWHRVAPEAPDRRAFLRWLEGAGADGSTGAGADGSTGVDADGSTGADTEGQTFDAHRAAVRDGLAREWGDLHVGVRLDDAGRRVYGLCNAADADAPTGDLTTYRDPDEAYALARFDDDGEYRPLKTARTLATGWAFVDLDADDLIRTVDAFYPATIANWHREREGDLDVTHWRAAAERQTGIYDLVDELSGEQVEWLAGAACVDSQCCKRREWDETADGDLGVPRGEGAFPCREPCSFLIAAARELALAERERAQTVELSLSGAELAQLERIVAAVADGEVEDVREGDVDDGASRIRARLFREKHFEDGHLPADRRD